VPLSLPSSPSVLPYGGSIAEPVPHLTVANASTRRRHRSCKPNSTKDGMWTSLWSEIWVDGGAVDGVQLMVVELVWVSPTLVDGRL
jgi:hypothetical protein